MPNADLDRFIRDEDFLWATGIEDTFISSPWGKTNRTLDEYELTGHYERFRQDADLIKSLGVKFARYGIPWYRIQPAEGRWDWSWADEAIGALVERGIEPILDLMHYGTPDWLTGSFADPDYPTRVADYAQAAAERYGKHIRWFTPLNEARITAYYCGRIGWWPPNLRGWRGFAAVMIGVAKGIVLCQERIREAVPQSVIAHVDACDLYATSVPSLEQECELRRNLVLLALDLITGRVDEHHALWSWLLKHKASEHDLEFLSAHAAEPDIVGLNLYPMYSQKQAVRTKSGARFGMNYAAPEIIETLSEIYYRRYRLPLFISETASVGSYARRLKWLHGSVDAVRAVRARGVPLVGYTWWPLFSLISWGYRQLGVHEMGYYLMNMGLWDLANQGPDPLQRIETPAAGEYRRIVKAGKQRVGTLREGES